MFMLQALKKKRSKCRERRVTFDSEQITHEILPGQIITRLETGMRLIRQQAKTNQPESILTETLNDTHAVLH